MCSLIGGFTAMVVFFKGKSSEQIVKKKPGFPWRLFYVLGRSLKTEVRMGY